MDNGLSPLCHPSLILHQSVMVHRSLGEVDATAPLPAGPGHWMECIALTLASLKDLSRRRADTPLGALGC